MYGPKHFKNILFFSTKREISFVSILLIVKTIKIAFKYVRIH